MGKVQIIQPPPDAYNFIEPDSHDEDLTHVIEVYEFPSTLKTEDLFVGNFFSITETILLKVMIIYFSSNASWKSSWFLSQMGRRYPRLGHLR